MQHNAFGARRSAPGIKDYLHLTVFQLGDRETKLGAKKLPMCITCPHLPLQIREARHPATVRPRRYQDVHYVFRV